MSANTISILIKAQDQASDTVKGAGDKVEAASNQIKAASKVAAIAVAAVATKIGVDAVKSAGDYQSSLSKLSYASGATAKEMGLLEQTATALGKSNDLAGVSAADAADTMTELAKAGLSVSDTLAAAKGTMSLAKAGNIDFADAATIAASALNAFGMSGKDATKVADMLASGANASQADLADLALGLQQSATVAKQFKLSLNENVTALSLFANNGIKGSDAGTSLKTMLISLAKPSKEAAYAMKEIGFQAYDAQGNFVGLDEMSLRLKKSISKLTDEQKQNTLATIFGTDAFRAAAVLSDNAGESFQKMSKLVGASGAAQKAASSQMGDYQRATEGLKNTVSDLSIRIGNKLLPSVTAVTNYVSRSAVSSFESLGDVLRGQVPVITGAGASIAAYGGIVGGVTLATKAWTLAQGALNIVMRANSVALGIAAAAGIVAAYVNVVNQSNSTTSATERLSLARQNLRAATDAQRDAEDRLRGAQLNAEGTALAVERAQQNLTLAVQQYGPKSLEAREAELQLKRARDDNEKSTAALRDRTNEANEANQKVVQSKKEIVEALRPMTSETQAWANSWGNVAERAKEAKKEVAKAGGLGKTSANTQLNSLMVGGHAIGTTYAPGGQTLVGENGPELVNLPRGAQVVPHYKTSRILNEQDGESAGKVDSKRVEAIGRGGATVVIENFTSYTEFDNRRFLRDIGFALEVS